jgi:hypothetical protein
MAASAPGAPVCLSVCLMAASAPGAAAEWSRRPQSIYEQRPACPRRRVVAAVDASIHLSARAGGRGVETVRRYEVASVWRRSGGRALPRSHLQADLDFVAPAAGVGADHLLAEAEVIKVRLCVCLICADRGRNGGHEPHLSVWLAGRVGAPTQKRAPGLDQAGALHSCPILLPVRPSPVQMSACPCNA